MKKAKFYLRILWTALIFIGLMLFFLYPDSFTKSALSAFINENSSYILFTYFGVLLVRGFFLLPSTPFVFAGILLFPESPFLVFWASLLGILITSVYLYFASRFLEFDKLFFEKNPNRTQQITKKLNKFGFWIVVGWSFFPFVPTDLICFIAGSLRMKFVKYISAILIGEAVLVGTYIYIGESIIG